ncbi:MAG: hypothetical protein IT208_10555 [Chthonomonadales bacterium]|nr:hypothetical protein [Chthonomonadales bacterium]
MGARKGGRGSATAGPGGGSVLKTLAFWVFLAVASFVLGALVLSPLLRFVGGDRGEPSPHTVQESPSRASTAPPPPAPPVQAARRGSRAVEPDIDIAPAKPAGVQPAETPDAGAQPSGEPAADGPGTQAEQTSADQADGSRPAPAVEPNGDTASSDPARDDGDTRSADRPRRQRGAPRAELERRVTRDRPPSEQESDVRRPRQRSRRADTAPPPRGSGSGGSIQQGESLDP